MSSLLRSALFALASVLFLTACQTPQQTGLSPHQIAVLKEQGFKWTDNGWELGLSGKVLFDVDSERVSAESTVSITRITKALLDADITHVALEGHTDNQGSATYNQELSLRRAKTVSVVMLSAGMRESDITLRGLGQMRPIADNNTAEGRSENRRVAIIVSAD